MNFLIDFLLTIFVIISLLLVLVVLLQRPRSEGLGTAFASGMVETFIGPAAGFLVKFTTWMGGLFFVLTILLAYLYSHRYSNTSVIGQNHLRQSPVQKQSASPTPAASLPPVKAGAPTAGSAASAAPGLPEPAAALPAPVVIPNSSPAAPATVVPDPTSTVAPPATGNAPGLVPVPGVASPAPSPAATAADAPKPQ